MSFTPDILVKTLFYLTLHIKEHPKAKLQYEMRDKDDPRVVDRRMQELVYAIHEVLEDLSP